MALTVPVEIPSRDRQVLTSWASSASVRPELALRASIVLLAAQGAGTGEIVAETGASKPTVIAWRKRYAAEGLRGLQDRQRPGRPRRTDDAAIVLATLEPPPPHLQVRHWSTRLLARELGVSNVRVAATWREYGLQPWRREAVRFGTVPQLQAQPRDVMGLYLNPPDYAVVLSAAADAQLTDGATAALGALHAGDGEHVSLAGHPARRHQWFLRFLQQAAAARLSAEMHVLAVENYVTRRHPDVRAWLARHPGITPHFASTQRAWLTMTEVFFALSTDPAVSGTVDGREAGSVSTSAAIRLAIDGWPGAGRPFSWTSAAGEPPQYLDPAS